MMVQFFYAWRILVLTKNWYVVAIVVFASTISGRTSLSPSLYEYGLTSPVVCALGTAIGISFTPHFTDFLKLDVVALPWLISCTVCDVVIALALSLYLRKHRTGFAHTDNVVNKIIRCMSHPLPVRIPL